MPAAAWYPPAGLPARVPVLPMIREALTAALPMIPGAPTAALMIREVPTAALPIWAMTSIKPGSFWK